MVTDHSFVFSVAPSSDATCLSLVCTCSGSTVSAGARPMSYEPPSITSTCLELHTVLAGLCATSSCAAFCLLARRFLPLVLPCSELKFSRCALKPSCCELKPSHCRFNHSHCGPSFSHASLRLLALYWPRFASPSFSLSSLSCSEQGCLSGTTAF